MVKLTVPYKQAEKMVNTTSSYTSKGVDWHKSCPLHSESHHTDISCKKGLTAKQAEYVHSKCTNEGIIGTEEEYKCSLTHKEKADSKLNPYECTMLNDFELCNVHAVSAEIEKWTILSTKVDYAEVNGKADIKKGTDK